MTAWSRPGGHRRSIAAILVAMSSGSVGAGAAAQDPTARDLNSGTTALLQAVSAPSERVVWVSGHEGVVLRSLDGGETWARRRVPTGDSLQFRDVHAFDAERAVILSAGPGDQSRIYRTADGGASWALSWLNQEPDGFYDCLDFFDERRGIAYGDAVDGELRVLLTGDGGASWRLLSPDRLPAPAGSEGGFAASGTCVVAGPEGRAWIGTGAGDRARLLRTSDYGASWEASDLPLVTGPAAGAFTVVLGAAGEGWVLGGDLRQADGFTDNVARTSDGGATWTLGGRPPFAGAVYGAALAVGEPGARLVAAGPGGLAVSSDGATSWSAVDTRAFWAAGAAGGRVWAVGPDGRIVVLGEGR